MTDVAPLTKEEEQQLNAEMKESPLYVSPEEASTNFYWTFGKNEIFKIQTTIRGNPTTEEINEHVASAISGMKLVVVAGGHATGYAEKQAPAPSVDSATAAALDSGKAVTPPPVATPAPASQAQSGAVLEMRIAKIEVTPKPDNKSEVKFFMDRHKFPDIYATQTIDSLVKMFAPVGAWTAEHFSKAGDFAVKFTVCYVLSEKLNSKGNPYKNITQLKP